MSIEKTVERGVYVVEIDDWGGCHFKWPDDHEDDHLSLSPEFMREIEAARKEVEADD